MRVSMHVAYHRRYLAASKAMHCTCGNHDVLYIIACQIVVYDAVDDSVTLIITIHVSSYRQMQ
jgi:hypothetical protein